MRYRATLHALCVVLPDAYERNKPHNEKIHVSAINRKVRDDEKLLLKSATENIMKSSLPLQTASRSIKRRSLYCFWQVRQGRARPQQR